MAKYPGIKKKRELEEIIDRFRRIKERAQKEASTLSE